MRLITSGILVLVFLVIPTAVCAEAGPGGHPNHVVNLIRNGSFSDGFEGWDKFHSSNVDDTWDLQIGGPHQCLAWKRERSHNDGGSVGAVQSMDVDVSGYKKLLLSIDVMVKHHSLLGSGWWSEERGGSGEYPVKIIIFYDDTQGNRHMWTHGFISTVKKQPVSYRDPDTGEIERHEGGTTLGNSTVIPKDKWFRYSVDLMAPGQLIDMDLESRGKQMPKPKKLVMIRLVGQGWDFAAAVDNVSLHGE